MERDPTMCKEYRHGRCGGKWGDRAWLAPRVDFADFVMKNYPASHYALFAAPFLPMREFGEPSPVLEEQARRYPKKSFSDQVKLLVVQYHMQAVESAYHRAEVSRAPGRAAGLCLERPPAAPPPSGPRATRAVGWPAAFSRRFSKGSVDCARRRAVDAPMRVFSGQRRADSSRRRAAH